MMFGSRDKDTICSVSTPSGIGGISVIRISGSNALKIVSKLIKNPPKIIESHRVFLANFIDFNTQSLIDEVCITPFLNNKSFTGEEVIEISCHGSPVICNLILDQLCNQGARIAERGEFTYRAFLNNRIDLVQAESVLSVIHSKSELSSKLALRQLKGDLSKKIAEVEDDILWCLAHIEASIDFSAEDIEIIKDDVLLLKLSQIQNKISSLIKSFKVGKMISDGIQLTLSGKPNTGKSSLMNLFLQNDRSIISPIAGTTRDVIKDEFLYDGLRFIIADTAGIRHKTDDVIEKIGIERTYKEQKEAQVNLFVFDFFEDPQNFDPLQFEYLNGFDFSTCFIIFNKMDLYLSSSAMESFKSEWKNLQQRINSNPEIDIFSVISDEKIKNLLKKAVNYLEKTRVFDANSHINLWLSEHLIFCSSMDAASRDLILGAVKNIWIHSGNVIENISVSSSRQFDDLNQAFSLINKTYAGVEEGLGHEFIAFDLKDALLSVQRILGIVYDDQILDKVFKEFCLGK